MYIKLDNIYKKSLIFMNDCIYSVEDIELLINIYIYYSGIKSFTNNEIINSKELKKQFISLKMELILKNILLYDTNIKYVTDEYLVNYLLTKVYLLTETFINRSFVISAINLYK